METIRIRGSLLVLVLLLPLVAACSARHISEAQTHFSKGAEIENAATAAQVGNLEDLSRQAADEARALHEYRLARGLLTRELKDNASKLREEKLLGTAKALNALATWRIGELEDRPTPRTELENLAKDVLDDRTVELGTRDRTVLKAFPAFADHRMGLAATTAADARKYFESALDVYETALDGVPADNGVRRYIRLAQAQSLKAWLEKDSGSAVAIQKRYKAIACALKRSWTESTALKNDFMSRATNLGYTWKDDHYTGCPDRNPYR